MTLKLSIDCSKLTITRECQADAFAQTDKSLLTNPEYSTRNQPVPILDDDLLMLYKAMDTSG